MRALAALSRFVGNTFAYWVLLFAVQIGRASCRERV